MKARLTHMSAKPAQRPKRRKPLKTDSRGLITIELLLLIIIALVIYLIYKHVLHAQH